MIGHAVIGLVYMAEFHSRHLLSGGGGGFETKITACFTHLGALHKSGTNVSDQVNSDPVDSNFDRSHSSHM